MSQVKRFGSRIIGACLLTLGLVMGVYCIAVAHRDVQHGWQQARGTITSWERQRRYVQGSRSLGHYEYDVRVSFQFEVAGKKFQSAEVDPGPAGPGDPASFGLGTKHTVYYNPADPAKSSLTLDRAHPTLGFVVAGLIIILGIKGLAAPPWSAFTDFSRSQLRRHE